MAFWKDPKNTPIIVAIALPVVTLLAVAISLYLPSFWVQPAYSFLYSTGYNHAYYVENGHIKRFVVKPEEASVYSQTPSMLYLYDTHHNLVMPVTFEMAERYRLNGNPVSPDGYELQTGNNSAGMWSMFWGNYNSSDYYTYTLSKNGFGKRVRLTGTQQGYQFVGWLKK